eukprot:2109921-Pyramimonas_sp.AAC.1
MRAQEEARPKATTAGVLRKRDCSRMGRRGCAKREEFPTAVLDARAHLTNVRMVSSVLAMSISSKCLAVRRLEPASNSSSRDVG